MILQDMRYNISRKKGYFYHATESKKSMCNSHIFRVTQSVFLCSEYQCFHIFLCLYFYFPSLFFPVVPFHVVNSLVSHSSCYFLHPRISRSSFSYSSSWTSFEHFLSSPFFIHSSHVTIPVKLFISYVIQNRILILIFL